MRMTSPQIMAAMIACALSIPATCNAQADAAKIFNANCSLCHSSNGSGDTPTGKALHAKDLRSDEVQKEEDAALNAAITKGKGKMPAFGAKLKADDVTKLVAYIRQLQKQK